MSTSTIYGNQHTPTEITVKKAERAVEITFEDGKIFCLPAELLRVESPSAEVQGHGPGQKLLVHGRREVAIIGMEPVGQYAIKIAFDDLHSSGIYTWDYLYWLGENRETIWTDYLTALELAQLSRDPCKGSSKGSRGHAPCGGVGAAPPPKA